MKRLIPCFTVLVLLHSSALAENSHLDIMVPDIKDTDLLGPVKSVKMEVCQNVSGESSTEMREYDRAGNLTKITKWDVDDELVETTTCLYDENGCYKNLLHKNEQRGFETEWEVVLNPETHQIALREKPDGRIGIETYSPAGYLINYRMLDKDRKPIVTNEYKRDEDNRLIQHTRIEGRKPEYTYYFKWAGNGFIDMEGQIYHQEKEQCRHTYEYLVIDDHGNWTQRIMVRYDISGKKPEKVYERTVKRIIEYYGEEDSDTDAEPAEVEDETDLGSEASIPGEGSPAEEDSDA